MSDKQQMTTATWIAILIAAVGATTTVGATMRASYYKDAAVQLVARENTRIDTLQTDVFGNRTDISVVKNDIATIKSDVHDIKVGLGLNGKVMQ